MLRKKLSKIFVFYTAIFGGSAAALSAGSDAAGDLRRDLRQLYWISCARRICSNAGALDQMPLDAVLRRFRFNALFKRFQPLYAVGNVLHVSPAFA